MSAPTRTFQTYRHHSGGIYTKLADALHTETEELLTVYVCAVSGAVFCRPKSMFEETVTVDTYTGPRFTPFPPETTKSQRKSLTYNDHPKT